MTKIHMTSKWSEVKPEGFYVYLHRRATDGVVFYVGKGKGDRAWRKSYRSKYWCRVAAKHGVTVEVVDGGLSEDDAFDVECGLIRIHADTICNLTAGGEGRSGRPQTEAQKKAASRATSKPVKCSNGMEFENIAGAVRWLRATGHDKACSTNISAACRGRKGIVYGYNWAYKSFDVKSLDKRAEYIERKKIPVSTACGKLSFDSAKSAAEWLSQNGYPKASKQNISASALGKRPMAYGYSWRFT